MKTPEDINRYVHEKRGKCWHYLCNVGLQNNEYNCVRCKKKNLTSISYKINPNYLIYGEAWGELLEWATKEPWWNDFIEWLEWETKYSLVDLFTDPTALATKITEHLEEKDGYS